MILILHLNIWYMESLSHCTFYLIWLSSDPFPNYYRLSGCSGSNHYKVIPALERISLNLSSGETLSKKRKSLCFLYWIKSGHESETDHAPWPFHCSSCLENIQKHIIFYWINGLTSLYPHRADWMSLYITRVQK